jgi:hypothetical protein
LSRTTQETGTHLDINTMEKGTIRSLVTQIQYQLLGSLGLTILRKLTLVHLPRMVCTPLNATQTRVCPVNPDQREERRSQGGIHKLSRQNIESFYY